MALPKEPRQKMINIMYLVLTALLALNVSSEILNAFKVVDKSLTGSNDNLNKANSTLYSSLKAKTEEAASAVNAKIWQPKAEQARKLSEDMNNYIESIKKQLKQEAGLTLENGVEKFKEDDLEAATRLFGDGEGGKKLGVELENKLKAYKAAMLAIDPEINTEFSKTLAVDGAPATGQDGKEKSFTDAYFHMTPTVAGLTLLSKFQNNVKNAENQVATFCHAKVGEVKVKFDKTGVLVGQSANYVMPGQEIEITAGIGAYSSAGAPQISIGGAAVPVVDGQGKYKFAATGSGKQTKTVTVRYKDQNGIDKTDSKEIEYTIGTPGGAAVMLDKMNVFYVGVDNPITIGSPTGWDKTNVSMSGGSISGNGSSRTVRVGSVGNASITVNADGKPSTFQFRCKAIPPPVFKVGSGRPRVAAVEFKNQAFCRAELENFDFDLKYNVVSAVVYFNGAGFSGVQQGTISSGDLGPIRALMAKCMPGSSVTFDNVKVSGPDGTKTIEGRTVQLY